VKDELEYLEAMIEQTTKDIVNEQYLKKIESARHDGVIDALSEMNQRFRDRREVLIGAQS